MPQYLFCFYGSLFKQNLTLRLLNNTIENYSKLNAHTDSTNGFQLTTVLLNKSTWIDYNVQK
jgi:hypothetical protein